MRSDQLILWLFSLCKPAQTLHESFQQFSRNIDSSVRYSSQVAVLEKLLSDLFGPGITITDGEGVDSVYLYEESSAVSGPFFYSEAEQVPQVIYLYAEGDELGEGVDFVVNIPNSIVFDEIALRSVVNTYKLSGKRYEINLV